MNGAGIPASLGRFHKKLDSIAGELADIEGDRVAICIDIHPLGPKDGSTIGDL